MQRDDRKDRGRKAHRDSPEHRPLARAVDRRVFVQFARQRIEEPLQQEDGVAVGQARKDQRRKRVQQVQLPEHEEDGYLRDHGRKRHRQHEEQEDLVGGRHPVAAQGVRGQRIDEQGEKHGKGAVNRRVQNAAAVEQEILQHGLVVARGELPAQFLPGIQEAEIVGVLLRRHNIHEVAKCRSALRVESADLPIFRPQIIPEQEFDAVNTQLPGRHPVFPAGVRVLPANDERRPIAQGQSVEGRLGHQGNIGK